MWDTIIKQTRNEIAMQITLEYLNPYSNRLFSFEINHKGFLEVKNEVKVAA